MADDSTTGSFREENDGSMIWESVDDDNYDEPDFSVPDEEWDEEFDGWIWRATQ